MPKESPSSSQRKGQHPSRSELRASVVWPVVIAAAIWLAGLIIWIVAPGRFDVLASIIIAVGLFIYLVWYQRSLRLTPGERIFSLLLAAPAILGITFGIIQGQAVYAITGVSASLLLLAAQRALTVPFSYRMARRAFDRGQLETALDLVGVLVKHAEVQGEHAADEQEEECPGEDLEEHALLRVRMDARCGTARGSAAVPCGQERWGGKRPGRAS